MIGNRVSIDHLLHLLAAHVQKGGVWLEQLDESGRVAQTYTWSQLFDRCHRQAVALARLFEPGATVCVMVRQDAVSVTSVLACIAAGLRAVCVHPGIAGPELQRCVEMAGARAVLEEIGADADADNVARNPGGVILSSSGTTGGPRMAVRDWSSLLANGQAVVQGLGLQGRDSVLVGVPLCHSYGVDLLFACMVSGAKMILLERATPASLAAGLAAGATIWPAVPFQLEQLLRTDMREHQVQTVVSAGSWLPEPVWREMRERWGICVGQLYGATEVGTVSVRQGRVSDCPASVAMIGTGVGDASLLVVDPHDLTRVCEPGEEGELLVRSSSMASGYVDGPLTSVYGYWRSGDIARRDRSGELTLTGRWKLLIDVGGYKVNPIEVERVIASHPGVASCVVVGVRASDTVERLRALFVPTDPSTPVSEEALRRFVRERLSAAKVPRVFERVDALPRSASGKIQRGQIY